MYIYHLVDYIYETECDKVYHEEGDKTHANSTIAESDVQKPVKKWNNTLFKLFIELHVASKTFWTLLHSRWTCINHQGHTYACMLIMVKM